MARRYRYHFFLRDLEPERPGLPIVSARTQAEALSQDREWSGLYLDGNYIGRHRTVAVEGDRVEQEAELRDDHELPPLMEISRFRGWMAEPGRAILEKFTIYVRPVLDSVEEIAQH